MIEQQARVLHADKDRVSVRIGGQSGCRACDEGKGCGAGLFGKLLKRKPVEIELGNSIGADIGQAVWVGLPESLFMKLVFRLYAWPLLAGLLGAIAGHWLAGRLGAGAGMVDMAALGGAVIAAGGALKIRNRTTTKDVSSGDICLLDKPEDETALQTCSAQSNLNDFEV